ncbi:GHKL domain-containing protein [Flavobacterium gillisiae]|uniref:GHKL domain-containing protein n=1 Tax=Flavobacterium gillisiae TaxID=150146 RepID=A0A1H4D5Z4_9FLAO|nr:histidine kinase [Flavobacterium gillisiae]SEA68061.1 GHKL domain-containing protein [Flavobacterium gillisiae]
MYNNKKITILSHLLVWLVLFSMPYILSSGQEQNINRVIAHFWIPFLFYAIIFYLNYFYIIDRFLFTKKNLAFIAINAVMIALFLLVKEQSVSTFFSELQRTPPNTGEGEKGPPFKLFIYMQMLPYIASLLFAIAAKTTKRLTKTEAESKEATNYKLKSELQHLHYQLQPHFFFNSLNNIYSLVDISPEQAKKTIHSLSKLMRYMLYETNLELVSLSKEVDFMKKYIELMQLRVSDKIVINANFPTSETGVQIAPLLFISLIENAFKHGVSATKESQISITMTVENKKVLFLIENNNFPKKTDDKSGSGIGLQNLKKRLELLYPNKHFFETTVKNNYFLVTLEIETA